MSSELPPCEHNRICNLPATHKEKYCILHLPNQNKSVPEFGAAVRQHLEAWHSDFRFVHFTGTNEAHFENKQFTGVADFRNAKCPSGLNLFRAQLPHGLLLTTHKIASIKLDEATVAGRVEIAGPSLQSDFTAIGAKFHGDVSLEVTHWNHVKLKAEFYGWVILRGRFNYGLIFDSAKIHSGLDLRSCTFVNQLSFEGTNFDASSELDLSQSYIQSKGLRITESAPAVIRLDGANVQGEVILKGESGKPRLRLIAPDTPPRFEGNVKFTNVDLSECKLLGNELREMTFTDVVWAKRYGRNVLYDEIAVRREWRKEWIPGRFSIGLLKESYQDLKQMHQDQGDHGKAGDFHYGEMEMKRCEYGLPRRVLCLEFLYWFLSGYGTMPLRAFVVLIIMALTFSWGYWVTNGEAFSGFAEVLRFSMQVMTLQRPSVPKLSEAGAWIKAVQAIAGPVQIALFALALRMRLKR